MSKNSSHNDTNKQFSFDISFELNYNNNTASNDIDIKRDEGKYAVSSEKDSSLKEVDEKQESSDNMSSQSQSQYSEEASDNKPIGSKTSSSSSVQQSSSDEDESVAEDDEESTSLDDGDGQAAKRDSQESLELEEEFLLEQKEAFKPGLWRRDMGLSTWKYQFSYNNWTQATMRSFNTWMGNRLSEVANP